MKKQVTTISNIAYNTFTTTGLANYASSTTAPNIGNEMFVQQILYENTILADGKYNSINVANWFLEKEPMTLGKLQKLMYYAFAWSWTKNHISLIKTSFFASSSGPISKDIDSFFEPKKDELLLPMPDFLTNFDNQSLELLESVWETYGDYTENALEVLSEDEAPWKIAFSVDPSGNSIIKVEQIIEFYNSIAI